MPTFTDRELEVLDGMSRGRTNGEIGLEIHISEDTVKTHARRLFRKLGARDRAHAVACAVRAGVLQIEGAVVRPPETPVCHPHRDTSRSVRLVADDHDAAVLSRAMFGPNPTNPDVALARSRDALDRLVGAS